jgi:hypothetical protein
MVNPFTSRQQAAVAQRVSTFAPNGTSTSAELCG